MILRNNHSLTNGTAAYRYQTTRRKLSDSSVTMQPNDELWAQDLASARWARSGLITHKVAPLFAQSPAESFTEGPPDQSEHTRAVWAKCERICCHVQPKEDRKFLSRTGARAAGRRAPLRGLNKLFETSRRWRAARIHMPCPKLAQHLLASRQVSSDRPTHRLAPTLGVRYLPPAVRGVHDDRS